MCRKPEVPRSENSHTESDLVLLKEKPESLSRLILASLANRLDCFFAVEPIISSSGRTLSFEAAVTALRSRFCLKTDCDVFKGLIGCVASTLLAGAVEVVRWDIVEADDGGGRLGKPESLDGNETDLETEGGSVILKDGGC